MGQSIITGTGACIPSVIRDNSDFYTQQFFDENKVALKQSPQVIVEKFRQITGIEARRYAPADLLTSDLATQAGEAAIADAGIDREKIDLIIVAHNFGDIHAGEHQSLCVPALAARVKQGLKIQHPGCIAFDLLFGCPGWVQGVITAHAYFKAGLSRCALVIGAETLSRVIEPFDRDSMIFGDGAGAAILEYREQASEQGILAVGSRTDALQEVDYINMGPSYNPELQEATRYVKMQGRKVYEYAMTQVPAAMKACMDECGARIEDLKMVFIHQANEKMDEGIIRRLYQLYGKTEIPELIMPMSIHWLGNSSVATVPTLIDLVKKSAIPGYALQPGDLILLASVGSGMHINAICYRW